MFPLYATTKTTNSCNSSVGGQNVSYVMMITLARPITVIKSSDLLASISTNLCTVSSCNPAMGCVTTSLSCNDYNPCTVDKCNLKTGFTNTLIVCNDFPCTMDSCDEYFRVVGVDKLQASLKERSSITTIHLKAMDLSSIQ